MPALSSNGPQPATENNVSRLSWERVEARLAKGAIAILPCGAGAKQHGFHLPMNTDAVQAESMAARLVETVPGLIWPTLTYGHYPAFSAYTGSVSLSDAAFEQSVFEIAEALLGWCSSLVVVLDTGLSTQRAISRALSRTRAPDHCVHVKLYDGPQFRQAVRQLAQQPHGSHADEIETSIMLALAPQLVDMTRAEPSPPIAGGPVAGALTPFDPASPNYSPSGAFGSPQLASAEKGAQLLAAMEADMLEAVRAAGA